jgi:S1-C subfamily serine protease
LRPDLEKTPLAYHSDYWRQLGERVKSKIVLVGSRSTPALVIEPGLAVSSPRLVEEAGETPFRLLGGGPESNLTLLELPPPSAAQAFVPSDPASLHPGLLVAAISLTADGSLLVVPGYLASAPRPLEDGSATGEEDSLDVAIPFPRSLATAAIVDLDGQLVGAAFEAGESLRTVSSAVLLRVVERLRTHPFCHAIEVAAMEDRVKELLGMAGGVLVERVRESSFAPGPSIHAGDVLLAWGDHEMTTPEEFRRAYEAQAPGHLVAFEVRRGRSRVRGSTVMPGPDCRPAGRSPVPLPRIGMTIGWTDDPEPGWGVLALTPGGPAATAGIEVRDRILRVDGLALPRSGVEARQRFERRSPALSILLRRDRHVRLIALSPDDE